MTTHIWRRCAAIISVSILAASSRAHADDIRRIRSNAHLQAVLDEMAGRSPRLVAILRTIDDSDVIVHVTCERFNTSLLDGRTLWVSATRDARYLRVQIDCQLPKARLVTILAHELQHVTEVAADPGVVDERSFARLFRTIGFSTCSVRAQFETDAAVAAGERVLREFNRRPARVQARVEDR